MVKGGRVRQRKKQKFYVFETVIAPKSHRPRIKIELENSENLNPKSRIFFTKKYVPHAKLHQILIWLELEWDCKSVPAQKT